MAEKTFLAAAPDVLVDVPRQELLDATLKQRTLTSEEELGEPRCIGHVATARWGELKTLTAVCVGDRVAVYATHHYGMVEKHDEAECLWEALPFPQGPGGGGPSTADGRFRRQTSAGSFASGANYDDDGQMSQVSAASASGFYSFNSNDPDLGRRGDGTLASPSQLVSSGVFSVGEELRRVAISPQYVATDLDGSSSSGGGGGSGSSSNKRRAAAAAAAEGSSSST